jgi:hypothetical protein
MGEKVEWYQLPEKDKEVVDSRINSNTNRMADGRTEFARAHRFLGSFCTGSKPRGLGA